jgi:hypothetical protein
MYCVATNSISPRCYGQEDRSVIWLTAVKDADVFVDYKNVGFNYDTYKVKALQCLKLKDAGDNDMVRLPLRR